jgi:hypothetical protein
MEKVGIQPYKHVLTKRELTKIRQVLPFNWRALLAESVDTISVRQITNVFAQNTGNARDNVIVWGYVNKILKAAGREKLAERVRARVSFYECLYNGEQQSDIDARKNLRICKPAQK